MSPDDGLAPQTCPICGARDFQFETATQIALCSACQGRGGATESTMPKASVPFLPLKIFLSYGHDEHVQAALRIKADLQARGHDVWFDVDRLQPGVDWEAYIDDGLRWCDKVILLMTPHSVRRRNLKDPESRDGFCLNELARAEALNKRIIPILLVEVEDGPPLKICRIQHLDLRDAIPIHEREDFYRPKLERLLRALENDESEFEGVQSDRKRRLQPIDFRGDWSQHLSHFHGREWLLQRVRTWLSDANGSRVFWLTASPGMGKTAFSAFLSNHVAEVIGCHFCVSGHDEKCDARRMVMSLAFQLCQSLPGFDRCLKEHDLDNVARCNAETLFDNLIITPLSGGQFAHGSPRLIVIDGLDEASRDGRNRIAELIRDRWTKTPPWLRLLVTSRPQEKELRSTQWGFHPYEFDADTAENRDDLRSYLRCHLDDSIRDDVIEELVDRSEGIFLYAAVILGELRAQRLSLSNLAGFPYGMAGYYSQFFARQFPDIEIYTRSIRPLLSVILAQRERLPLALLRQLSESPPDDLDQYLDALGSLFPQQGQDANSQTIAPFHKSLVDWMTTKDPRGRPIAAPYAIDIQVGKRSLAEHLWKNWTTHSAASSDRVRDALVVYERRHLIGHLVDVDRLDDACRALTDLEFVEARCRADQVTGLFEDYALVLGVLPEAKAEESEEQRIESALMEYVRALFLHAHASTQFPLPSPPELAPLRSHPSPGPSPRRWSRPDRLRAWRSFLTRHRSEMTAVQQDGMSLFATAINSAANGPVVEAMEQRLHDPTLRPSTPWFRKWNRTPFVLNPLCLSSEHIDTEDSIVWGRFGGTRMLMANIHPEDQSEPSQGAVTVQQINLTNLNRYSQEVEFECPQFLEQGESSIVSLTLSATGAWGVIGRRDGKATVWDLNAHRCVLCLTNHEGDGVTAAWISADGRSVLTGAGSAQSGSINEWSTSEGHYISACAVAGRVDALDATPDMTWVLAGLSHHSFAATLFHHQQGNWEAVDWPEAESLVDVKAVAMTPNGKRLAIVDREDCLTIWDRELERDWSSEDKDGVEPWAPPRLVRTIPCSGDEIYQITLTPDGGLCSTHGRRRVSTWDLRSPEDASQEDAALTSLGLVAVSPSGEFIGYSQTANAGTVEETTELGLRHVVRGKIREERVPISPGHPAVQDKSDLFAGPDQGGGGLANRSRVNGLAVSLWGKLVARCDDFDCRWIDIEGYRLVLVSPDLTREPVSVMQTLRSVSYSGAYRFHGPHLHPDGQTTIVQTLHLDHESCDGGHRLVQTHTAEKWQIATGASTPLPFDVGVIHCISSDGETVFSNVLDKFAAYEVRTGHQQWSHDAPVVSCVTCADPRYILLEREAHNVQVCEAQTGKILRTYYNLADSDEPLLAYGLTPNLMHWICVTNRAVSLWDTRTEELIASEWPPPGTTIMAASLGGATVALVLNSPVEQASRMLEVWRIEGLFGATKPPVSVVAVRSWLPEEEPPYLTTPTVSVDDSQTNPNDCSLVSDMNCHSLTDDGIVLEANTDDDVFCLFDDEEPPEAPLRIVCPSCFRNGPISADRLGTTVTCPICHSRLAIFHRACVFAK